jgi:fatty-acyl-CoA synthase
VRVTRRLEGDSTVNRHHFMPSYVNGPTALPLLGETIGSNFDRTALAFAEHEALVVPFQGVRHTYAALQHAVDRLARGLLAYGIERGARVGIWSPNNAEWVVVQYATAKVGAILVNVNPAYRANELEYALAQSGCRMVFAATKFKSSDYRQMLADAEPVLPSLERVIFFGTSAWDEILAAGDTVDTEELERRGAELSFDDPINIQYTSGTTGYPKGATLSHHNILNNAYLAGAACEYTENDRVCVPVPLYHCFGMVIGSLACATRGAAIVLPAPAFDPRATLEAVEAERCTSLYGVPTMFIAELALDDFASFDLSSLRTGIMGGAPCPVEVMKRCMSEMHMEQITICYGMTETSPVSTQTAGDDPLDQRVGSVGRVHPHVEIKIVDPDSGVTVPRGVAGELCTRGYSVMLGYWNEPERTAEAIDSARWMHTGDLATMDDDGYISIVGRIKDMIIRGGENVYPREIEEFLHTHPDIVDVEVIGVPDERYGEEIMAWIKVRDGAALTAEDVASFCRGHIARYKVPRHIHITDDFPMTVTGKKQKFLMRERAVGLLGLRGVAA